jgi:tetratricopeptide (TPR) repeat protein
LVEDQTAEVWLGGSDWNEYVLVAVRIVDDIGRTVCEPGVEVSGPTVGENCFRRATLAAVDLPPGDYTLIVTLSDDNGGELLRRPLPVTVVGAGDPVEWTSARSPRPVGGGTVVDTVDQQKPKIDKEATRAAYRRALVQLGEGDRVAARRSVMELESGVVANPSSKAVKTLAEIEYSEAKALAELDPDSLSPVLFLHRELCRSYGARRQGILEYHSREMTMDLASLLARLQPDSPFPLGLMVNLAGDFARMGASGAARSLLERTLVFSPEYQPALLALGFSFEQNGEYGRAVAIFRRLVDAYPDDNEGRLRLAINLIRTGREDKGEELLRDLIEGDARLWIRTIAAQELIRFLIDSGSLVEAERAVHLALERVPEDQRLWILLAAIMEKANRHSEAIEILERLPPASPGVSARARYAEWPAPSADVSLATLMAQAAAATPILQSTLARQGSRG